MTRAYVRTRRVEGHRGNNEIAGIGIGGQFRNIQALLLPQIIKILGLSMSLTTQSKDQ